jgi:integral membrane protein (TIGR01906 family)
MTVETTHPAVHERNFTDRLQPLWILFQLTLTILVPILLTLLSVRLVMTPLFLNIEYNRPGFPADRYGMTTAERLEYAPYALNYLLNGQDISYLADLRFPNGQPMYNSRELRHMVDVKVVTRAAYFLLFFGTLTALSLIILMSSVREARRHLRRGLFDGSILTLSIIGVIVVGAVLAWDVFFTLFHDLFFESGTWRFAFSDTLIRLFPEQFWFDAALTIGFITTVSAVIIAITISIWRRNAAPHR